jgi:hypothetical protein
MINLGRVGLLVARGVAYKIKVINFTTPMPFESINENLVLKITT